MKFRLPEDCSSGIGIEGEWYAAEFGVVDLPDRVVLDNAECIASHGLTVEPVVEAPAEKSDEPRKPGRPAKAS